MTLIKCQSINNEYTRIWFAFKYGRNDSCMFGNSQLQYIPCTPLTAFWMIENRLIKTVRKQCIFSCTLSGRWFQWQCSTNIYLLFVFAWDRRNLGESCILYTLRNKDFRKGSSSTALIYFLWNIWKGKKKHQGFVIDYSAYFGLISLLRK